MAGGLAWELAPQRRCGRSFVRLAASLATFFGIVAVSALLPSAASAGRHIDAVKDALNQRNPGTENKVWYHSRRNALPGNWLLQTPDCWGQRVCDENPPRAGDRYVRRIVQMITDARESVDINTLLPAPDREFRGAILEGLRQAAARGNRPVVRLLVGSPPCKVPRNCMDVDDYLRDFDRELHGAKLPVQVAAVSTYREGPPPFFVTSWNHSKVIVVDGANAIVGGMNYYAKDYLQAIDPANDVSMAVRGPAALHVKAFGDVLWRWACAHRDPHKHLVDFAEKRIGGDGCLGESVQIPDHFAGYVEILTLGRLGNGISVPGEGSKESPPIPPPPVQGSACHRLQQQRSDTNTSREYEYRNAGETGLRALIASARRSIFISQQDMLSCVYSVEALFDERVFAALARKVADDIPIKIVVSDDGATVGGHSYSNQGRFLAEPIKQTAETLTRVLAAQQGTSYAHARSLVCRNVGLASLRNSAFSQWPNGSRYANHAKVVSVDDEAFYVGSQNLYPARLQELGLIVEDGSASDTLKRDYLDPMWRQSRGLAYINPSEGVCGPF